MYALNWWEDRQTCPFLLSSEVRGLLKSRHLLPCRAKLPSLHNQAASTRTLFQIPSPTNITSLLLVVISSARPYSIMLCKYCNDFDYDARVASDNPGAGYPAYPRHATVGDLEASANTGCEICQLAINTSGSDGSPGFSIKKYRQCPITSKLVQPPGIRWLANYLPDHTR
jgi:hypothetical protein